MSSDGPRPRVATVSELRLARFKSFTDAVLPLGPATILLGRNSSGKSNALDGLEVLARLAEGEDLSDALDGRRKERGAVRGGSQGLPSHGEVSFELGCTVAVDGEDTYRYNVEIQVDPVLQVLSERLIGPGQSTKSGSWNPRTELVVSENTDDAEPVIPARVFNGSRGTNPAHRFRDNRVILSQLGAVLLGQNRGERSVLDGAETVRHALRGIFHLDPVPHLMRGYVHPRDHTLRRTAENISPMLRQLSEAEPEAFAQLTELIKRVGDEGIEGVEFGSTDFGEVMMALSERSPDGAAERTPAREMSDGLLRFTAIAAALLSTEFGLDVDSAVDLEHRGERLEPGVLLVIEELENGLHPSQAGRMLSLVKESSQRPGTSVLVTTHSPALLNAAEGQLNDAVYVAHRHPETRFSCITPLMELPGYLTAMAEGSLGEAVTQERLFRFSQEEADYSDFERMLGLTE